MIPKLEIVGLNAWFGRTQALKDITIAVPANRVLAIIGPSGCGKSTFVRCINRMHELIPEARSEGRVLLDGIEVYSKLDPVDLRRRVGMVFQRPNVFPTLSIRENVLAGLRLNRVGGDHEAVLETALKRTALWHEVKDRLNANATQLSGGQQQRLCLARALAVDPEVLLMDEPASALDPIATAKIEELIDELKQTYTIVIVTHNMQQAIRVSDETAFFYMGEMIEHAATRDLFGRPAKKQTEDYVTGRFG